MIIIIFLLLWLVGVGFTLGLVADKDTPKIGLVLIYIMWPIILGEYFKIILEGSNKCS